MEEFTGQGAEDDMWRFRGWMVVVMVCCAAGVAHGEAPPDTRLREAQTAFDEVSTLWNAGRYDDAIARGEHALALREAVLGSAHPDVAGCLVLLGAHHLLRGNIVRAEPLLQRALAIQEATLGQQHPEVARTLTHLAEFHGHQRSYARAEQLFQRALALREATLGEHHPLVAGVLWRLVWLHQVQGLSARAEPLFQRALAIQETVLDQNPPDEVSALLLLAAAYVQRGAFARAESLYERALALQEAALGKSHFLVADTLYRFAVACAMHGAYSRAEPLHERSLAIREATFGKNHHQVSYPVAALGNLYLAQGLYARAEPYIERALAIREETFGERGYEVALSLGSLGGLYMAQGLYVRAQPYLERSLAIVEATTDGNALPLAKPLGRLGNLYRLQGSYARAEPLLRRALATAEAAYGKNDVDVAAALHDLADLYSAQGLYGRARPLYERALAIREANFGENHPRGDAVLNQLAVGQLARHRLDEALPLFTRAFAMSEQRLRQEMLGLSETHLTHVLQSLRTEEERLYALLRAHPEDARVGRLALGAALLLKGRSVQESADISRTIYRGLDTQDRATFERLRALRGQLARLSLQGRGSLPLAVHQQRLDELSAQVTALETNLARRSTPLRALLARPPPAEIVDRVASALPRDGALIEFISYVDRPLVVRPGASEAQRAGRPRYLALVLFADATLRFRDLGPAEPIDSAAARLRHALANRDATFQASAQALHQLVFQPLLPLLGTTRRLFLSPDGQLALVPFAALHDGHQFLVDAFDFTYLPSGRNLLHRPQESGSPSSVIVLADPDFSASPTALPPSSQEDAPSWASRSPAVERSVATLREHLARGGWTPAPLPGTRQEAEAIQRLLPQAQLFLGPEATKARLLSLPPPGILHLATHGFFLGEAPAPTASRGVGHFGALGEDPLATPPSDPMLRSGIVLAGVYASAPSGSSPVPPPPDSGLVTALELAGIDLWGTQLVVLSACDTGRGDVKPGQGVYGLHRAFLVAGAETVVMSLWKVNDETTRALMEAYYSNLLAGQGRVMALREAMRTLRRARPHPHYWAPFIAMGRDTPLHLLVPSPPLGPFSSTPD